MSTPSRFDNRLTRLGFHFLFLGSFAIFGGAVRGFNLLLVLAAMLIGALLIQWRWSRHSIGSITVNRRLPREVFAENPFVVRFRLSNHNRLLTAWMLRLIDRIERSSGSDQAAAGCGVAAIPAGRTVSADYRCVIARRGRYRFGPVQLETTFPLSLFRCRRTIDDEQEICVFPRQLQLRQHWQRYLSGRQGGAAATARRSGSGEGEFFGLREWQTGDSPKWIHWRTTARLTEPAVRQFEQQRRFDLCVVVDAFAESQADDEHAETAISLAATLVSKMTVSPSNRIVIGAAGAANDAVIGGGTDSAKRRMLMLLADVKTSDQPKLDDAVRQTLSLAGSARDLIIVSSRAQAEAATHNGTVNIRPLNLATIVTPQCNVQWIDVRQDTLANWVAEEPA
jgi:uncharacterized protein (DUF58 family)